MPLVANAMMLVLKVLARAVVPVFLNKVMVIATSLPEKLCCLNWGFVCSKHEVPLSISNKTFTAKSHRNFTRCYF